MKTEGLTNSKFASILGIQRSNVTHIVDGRNRPSLSFIEKLMSKFPHVNIEWLINGTGEMYKQNETSGQKSVLLFPAVVPEQLPDNQAENQTVLQNPVQQAENDRIPESVQVSGQITNPENPVSTSSPEPETASPVDTDKMKSESNPEADLKADSTVNNENSPQISQQSNIAEQDLTGKSEEKEIESVLIFYIDKTFKQYKPF
jgi:hypothetical protein